MAEKVLPDLVAGELHGMKEKIIFCWSGGKDSALALHRILQDDRHEVVTLLTTCNEHFQRVSMHGVRLELLDAQAEAIVAAAFRGLEK